VQVPGPWLQRHGQGVVVGRHAAQIAPDEGHHRPALALPVQVEEVADDHPQGVQVPVQRRGEPGGADRHVPEALDLRRVPRRSLGPVDPRRVVADVVPQRVAFRQGRQFRDTVYHPHRVPARIGQVDGVAAAVRGDPGVRGTGQPVQIRAGVRRERRPDEPGRRPASYHQARRTGPVPAQYQRLRGAVADREAEVGQEPLGPGQIPLLELQPGQADDLDQRIARPPRMLPGPPAGIAVQRPVRIHRSLGAQFHHDRSPCREAHLESTIGLVTDYQF
jgi:hypothetical protein